MAKFKIHKTKDYTTMSNSHFKEKEMTLKAKGLLSLMLSLPDDWDFSEVGLSKLSKDGVGSTAKALDELEAFGYLKRTQSKDSGGKFAGYDYDIYEKPQINSPYIENPFTEKPVTENQAQLSTNILSNKPIKHNKHTNTKISITDIVNEFNFSEKVKLKIEEWLEYKKEKNQSYKPKGLRAFCKKREEDVKAYGESYVIEMIDYSMCQNYSGVFAPKQKKPEPEKARYGNFDVNDAYANALERTMNYEDLGGNL